MSTMAYFTIPKELETNPMYESLSVEARYLYGHMRDTLKLSIKNDWRDDQGVYIRMTRVKMGLLLKKSLPTVRKIIAELVDVGLLKEKREGLTHSNRLYVQLLPGEDVAAFQSKVQKASPPDRTPDFTTEGNGFAPNQRNLSDPNPNERNNTKEPRRWFIKPGSIWFENGRLWQFIDEDIEPYRTRSELQKLFDDAVVTV